MIGSRTWRIGAGVLMAGAIGLLAPVALSAAVTLGIANRGAVTDVAGATTHTSIVVNSHAHAVYTLTGDSSRHPKCTTASGCLQVWPPVTVASSHRLRAAHGVRGHLGVWRHQGVSQLTVNGHPLYTYAGDAARRQAHGEGIVSFGGTWHVLTPSGKTVAVPTPAPSAPPASGCSPPLCY